MDGKYLATAGFDYAARVYELYITPGAARAELLHTLTGHSQAPPVGGLFPGVTTVAFNPDGSKPATGGADGYVKVWLVETGQELWSGKPIPQAWESPTWPSARNQSTW
jgi:WD40 repeat protein